MTKISIVILFNLLIMGNINLTAQTVKITEVPESIESFIDFRNKVAVTPEGGAAVFLLALKIYTENQTLGAQCLVAAADLNSLTGGDTYKGYSLSNWDMSLIKSQLLEKNKKTANSYIKGSSVENSYAVKLPYIYEFSSNAYSGDPASGSFKIFVKCSGADSARPINLKQNNRGIWKASGWSSLLTGIKKPPVDDDL